jgi:hypothetical protein
MAGLKILPGHKAGVLGKAVGHVEGAAPWSIRGSSLSNRNDEILPLQRAVLTYYWVRNTYITILYMYPEPGGLRRRILQPPDTYTNTAHAS